MPYLSTQHMELSEIDTPPMGSNSGMSLDVHVSDRGENGGYERTMAKNSGFLETLIKSAFGYGTTVHYSKDWLGHTQKTVRYHDTGKARTSSYGHGLFGDVTKTSTTLRGRDFERGRIKPRFFGGSTEHATRADGTQVERTVTPGLFAKKRKTHVNGQCWKCEGSGSKTFDCRPCSGTGIFRFGKTCRRCSGSGKFRLTCNKCGGSGTYSKTTSR